MDEYLSQGSGRVPFYMARQAADELLASQGDENGDGELPTPAHLQGIPTPAENEAAMADLMAQMAGVKRSV